MGILNVTPDSFFDGGRYDNIEKALNHARQMIKAGADIIDIGGESTRPGSVFVSESEELQRVIPIIKELSKETNIPISIDTYKSLVAEKAIEAGAQIVNDVSGMQAEKEMPKVVASNNTPIIIMHIKGQPHNFSKCPAYDNVINEIIAFFREKVEYAVNSGIDKSKIIIDPGIGFGKAPEHNLEILNRLDLLTCLGLPIMIGTSRKSFIKGVLGGGEENDDVSMLNSPLIGTLVSLVIAITKDANIVRVHDVEEAHQIVKMCKAIESTN